MHHPMGVFGIARPQVRIGEDLLGQCREANLAQGIAGLLQNLPPQGGFQRFIPSAYKGQYAWRGLKTARTVFSSSTCRQHAFVLRPCPRRFQFPGRSEGVFRMQAAFMRSAKGRLVMAIVYNRRA